MGSNLPGARRLSESGTVAVGTGCQYVLAIDGVVVPTEPALGFESRVSPNMSVNARLDCPAEASLRINDDAALTAPVTLDELRRGLEDRAAITSSASGRSCTYRPNLELSGDGLRLLTVNTNCGAATP